jgi:2-deoxy-scyllo-inosamine dehydrogenase (SAM-dependent)/8-amino-3,8-dideoxy-alpha-D-manno-octulosonate transaminase
VLPCYEDYLQRNAMGNIREHHLAEIWSSEKFRSFRRSLRAAERSAHPGCRDCNNSLVIT